MTTPILPYSQSPTPPAFARFLLRPIGWPFFSLATLIAFYILWLARIPDNFFGAFQSVLLSAALSLLFLLRLTLRLLLWKIYKRPMRESLPGLKPFALALLFPLLVAIFLALDLPFRLAFKISEPALLREAAAARASILPSIAGYSVVSASRGPTRIGLFPISETSFDPSSNTVHFTLQDAGFLDSVGLAHSPTTAPANADTTYRHHRGPWYRFRTHF